MSMEIMDLAAWCCPRGRRPRRASPPTPSATCCAPRPPRSVTLIGLGPATNLALALATEPALAERVAEIVLMTGAVGEGNATPSAEFNAWNDPEALAIVLAAGAPVTLATLDVTHQALCTPAHIAALRAAGQGACLTAAARIWERGEAVAPLRRARA